MLRVSETDRQTDRQTNISSYRRCPQIVPVATIRGTRTHMQIISDDSHWASTRAVCVVRLVSTANNRTER